MEKSAFTLGEVAAITEHSVGMLDYLCRTGVVEPVNADETWHGKRRLFSFSQLLFLVFIKRVLKGGMSVRKLKSAIGSKIFSELQLQDYARVITDGKSLILIGTDGTVTDVSNRGQLLFSFMVDVNDLMRHTSERLKLLETGALQPRQQNRRRPISVADA